MLVNTVEMFSEVVEKIKQASIVVVDTETTGLEWVRDRLCGVAIYCDGESFYFPFRHGEGINLPLDLLRVLICDVLTPDKVHIGHHYSFDMKILSADGMVIPEKIEDTLLLAHLMDENEVHKLEELGKKYLGVQYGDAEDALLEEIHRRYKKKGKDAKSLLWKLPPEIVAPYAEQDVKTTWELREFYIPHAKKWEVYDLWESVCDFQRYATKIELRGIKLDTSLIHQYIAEAEEKANEYLVAIQKDVGYEANPASSKQMQAWLGVESTASDILEYMEDDRAKLLKNYRLWSKVNNTYYLPFLEKMDSEEVLHPNYSLTGTVSGRLSCRSPNLQAIPRATDAYKVKDVFIARPGFNLVEADYSQAEMRVAAHYADERKLKEMFVAGGDLHQQVAEQMKISRTTAKQLNFSVLYGMGAKTFASRYHIPLQEADQYLKNYHKNFPRLRQLYFDATRAGEDRGYIRMYTGRVRRFNSFDAPTHKASNNLIQGSVAEMMRLSIMEICKTLPEVHILLTVHDSILFEVPQDRFTELCKKVKGIMEKQEWCSVPIIADFKWGYSWGNLQKMEVV
jgi:DNA polymerase-1